MGRVDFLGGRVDKEGGWERSTTRETSKGSVVVEEGGVGSTLVGKVDGDVLGGIGEGEIIRY